MQLGLTDINLIKRKMNRREKNKKKRKINTIYLISLIIINTELLQMYLKENFHAAITLYEFIVLSTTKTISLPSF